MGRLIKSGMGIVLAALLVVGAPALAQAIVISGMGGYQFGGQIETSSGDLQLKDNVAFALELEIPLKFKTGTSLALMWDMQPTELELDASAGKVPLGDLTAHYFQGGVMYNLKTDNPDLVPFTQVTLGATYLVPSQGDSKTKFSFAFGAGLKYAVNPKIAIRLQGELFATMLSSDVWAGVGTGGANLSIGGQALLQGAVMGGVTLSLGGKGKETQPTQAPPQESMPVQQPPAQQPPPQQPPAQQPPATQPPATQPPASQPPATEPPATQPPATQPPATQPPATEPPATTPPSR